MAFKYPLRVVVLAGQSNMVGFRTTLEDLSPRWRKPLAGCLYWTQNGWIPLAPGQLDQRTAFGPELSLAQKLSQVDDMPVGIVKVARNGSFLGRHWAPTLKGGPFKRLIRQTQAAMASGPVQLCGLAWFQGEADSINEEDADLYSERFEEFIGSVRSSLGTPNLPVVAAIVNPPEEECPYRETVRNALSSARIDNYATVPMDDLQMQADQLHLTPGGLSKIGKRFAQTIMDHPSKPLIRHWLWNTQNYQCWYSGPETLPKRLVISFPHAVADSGFGEFGFGQQMFEEGGLGTIYIRSNKSNWFQHDEVFPLAEHIRDYVGPNTELTLYGASMGAYGALLLSGRLVPKRVFAIAPQYSIDRSVVPWEKRWRKAARRIDGFRHNLEDHVDPKAQKVLFFDGMSLDRKQIDLMPNDETWSLINMPFASHQVLRYLQETGCLSLLASGFTQEDFDLEKIVRLGRNNRRKSAIYWMNLAKICAERRPEIARRAYQKAISCGGPARRIKQAIDLLPHQNNEH